MTTEIQTALDKQLKQIHDFVNAQGGVAQNKEDEAANEVIDEILEYLDGLGYEEFLDTNSQPKSRREEYLMTVQEQFAEATREELLQQIAFCWKKQDDQTERLKELRYDLIADPRPRRFG